MFYRIIVKGVVQGVGFRPYIYREAKQQGLKGTVRNIGEGIEIVINNKDFISSLKNLPPLSQIDTVDIFESNESFEDFKIEKSRQNSRASLVPPDISICENCKAELLDKNNKRHDYYFITCTDCGPRFTIINSHPYDRHTTTMDEFNMCDECRKEYSDPENRRYHAQTIACKKCGPKLKLFDGKKDLSENNDRETIRKAAGLLKKGEILSIKGIGGIHIAGIAEERVVKKIRKTLGRNHKPFAVMVKDVEEAKIIANFDNYEVEILESIQKPIVVLKKKQEMNFVSELDTIGIMLPYTALHIMLLEEIKKPLVMTSCNLPGDPIHKEKPLTKIVLTHQRRISNRCDDSVVKMIEKKVFYLRRARGYTPLPVKLNTSVKPTLAIGADMNNTFCLAKGTDCFISQHIGEMSNPDTQKILRKTIMRMIDFTKIKPEIIVSDLNPAYYSTLIAEELSKKFKIPQKKVQHHKSHIIGAGEENRLKNFIGISMDGLGYGEDGKIWGGEVFRKTGNNSVRIGRLENHLQIGGDAAAINPKKMLFGVLSKFLDKEKIVKLRIFEKKEIDVYTKMKIEGYNTFLTSSAGRVLDSVSALLNFCDERTYDGRPAMILEANSTVPYRIKPEIYKKEGLKVLSTTKLFRFLLNNLEKDKKRLAATAQQYIAEGLFMIADKKMPIVFSGGVAYNRIISSFLMNKGCLTNNDIPVGDGGLCYGQVVLANLEN